MTCGMKSVWKLSTSGNTAGKRWCAGAVCAALFERLGRRGAPLAGPLLERVGELCATAAEAAEEADGEEEGAAPGVEYAAAAAAAMGAALRHLGPEEVLRVLPLNLDEVRNAVRLP